MVRHLVGLQAQENLPPYLSLAARLTSFDPARRHRRAGGPVAGAVPDDARHRAPAGRGRRADPAAVDRARARARDQDQPEHRRRPATWTARRSSTRSRRCSTTVRSPRRRSGPRWPNGSPTYRPPSSGSWPGRPRRWCSARRAAPGRAAVAWSTSTSTAGSAGRWSSPTWRRSCAATCARSARPPPPTSPPGRASPGSCRWSRRWTTWSPTRTSRASRSTTCRGSSWPTRTPRRRSGCSASTTTSGSRTPAGTG